MAITNRGMVEQLKDIMRDTRLVDKLNDAIRSCIYDSAEYAVDAFGFDNLQSSMDYEFIRIALEELLLGKSYEDNDLNERIQESKEYWAEELCSEGRCEECPYWVVVDGCDVDCSRDKGFSKDRITTGLI